MVTVHYSNLYGVSYFAIFLAAAGYSAQAPGIVSNYFLELDLPLMVKQGAWISNNVVSPTKRAASIGFMMAWGSVGGGGIGSNIYIAEQVRHGPLLAFDPLTRLDRLPPIPSDSASRSARPSWAL